MALARACVAGLCVLHAMEVEAIRVFATDFAVVVVGLPPSPCSKWLRFMDAGIFAHAA